jgi:hypothetical protein
VLASRNHHFSLVQTENFTHGITFSSDVTVLSNWELSESELDALEIASHQRSIVVDCSDPALIDNDLYRTQLSLANLVTVPNEWMRVSVRAMNTNAWIVPSCVDLPHFALANQVKLEKERPLAIGCLGPYDWYLVQEAVCQLLEVHPKLAILAGLKAFDVFESHPRILGIDPTVHNLPELLRNCHIGLCPMDGESGYDDIWRYEYGALCRPVIAPHPFAKHDTAFWVKSIEELLADSKLRADLGHKAYADANNHRATKLADRYIAIYRKRLPHLWLS